MSAVRVLCGFFEKKKKSCYYIYFFLCVCVAMRDTAFVWSQRTTCRSQSPYTTWILGIELWVVQLGGKCPYPRSLFLPRMLYFDRIPNLLSVNAQRQGQQIYGTHMTVPLSHALGRHQ